MKLTMLLIPLIVERDFTFVTSNAVDFRRLYHRLSLHAGLILILDQLNRRSGFRRRTLLVKDLEC